MECLCRPEHGTNFNDSPGGMMKTQKRCETHKSQAPLLVVVSGASLRGPLLVGTDCLWSLPLLLDTLGIGNSLEEGVETVVTNAELARTLAFQCRVGDGDGIEDAGAASNQLLRRIVASLGTDQSSGDACKYTRNLPVACGVYTFCDSLCVVTADVMDLTDAVGTSWWGANLKETFLAAVMWVGTKGTRTPLHADDRPQFLVQLAGDKHVTLFPEITEQAHAQSAVACDFQQSSER